MPDRSTPLRSENAPTVSTTPISGSGAGCDWLCERQNQCERTHSNLLGGFRCRLRISRLASRFAGWCCYGRLMVRDLSLFHKGPTRLTKTALRETLGRHADGTSPRLWRAGDGHHEPVRSSLIERGLAPGGFRRETFARMRTGYIASGPNDSALNNVFNRRTGPISAALAVTLDAP